VVPLCAQEYRAGGLDPTGADQGLVELRGVATTHPSQGRRSKPRILMDFGVETRFVDNLVMPGTRSSATANVLPHVAEDRKLEKTIPKAPPRCTTVSLTVSQNTAKHSPHVDNKLLR